MTLERVLWRAGCVLHFTSDTCHRDRCVLGAFCNFPHKRTQSMAPESCLDTDGCAVGAFCIFLQNLTLTYSMAPDIMCDMEVWCFLYYPTLT